jgi:predicted ATP-dependent serine protease
LCGAELTPGNPQCSACGQWNIIPDEREKESRFISLAEAPDVERARLCKRSWWSSIFGGGFVYRQCILIGGGPGGGKSTFAKQVGEVCFNETHKPALYLASEEATADVKAAAVRLGINPDCFAIPGETPDGDMECLDEEDEFSIVIADSIPDFIGDDLNAGVALLKRLKQYSMERNTPTLCIDHVNKDEALAGLRRWEHIVDTTVLIHGDEEEPNRTMQVRKNRFGQGHQKIELDMRGKDEATPGALYPRHMVQKRGIWRCERCDSTDCVGGKRCKNSPSVTMVKKNAKKTTGDVK